MKTLSYSLAVQRLATLLAVVALSLVLLAAVTGILLAFYYDPSAGGAYESLRMISEDIPGGSLIRDLHNIAGNAIIAVALLQIIVLFLGRQFNRGWFTAWLSGGFLALVSIGLGWTAIILDWDQLGYWRLKIELGIIGGLPIIGEPLRDVLQGGESIGTTTVEHMYTLHSYLLSVVAVVLSVTHLGALIYQEYRARRQSTIEQSASAQKELEQEQEQELVAR